MAHVAERFETGRLHSILEGFQSFLASIATSISAHRDHEARFRQIQKLQALSDEELAELGIKRDRIAQYVFRDLYYV